MIEKLLARGLDDIGYESAVEVELRLNAAYELIPDVIATEGTLEEPYPTKPFEVAIEILSPQDPFSRVLRKCRLYEKWGIQQIVVINPADRIVWRFENGVAMESDVIATRGEAKILAATLWEALDRRKA